MSQLTKRERLLAGIVGTILFVLLNAFVLNHLFRTQATLRADRTMKTAEWQAMQVLASERALWLKRDAWVNQKLPKLAKNENQAAGDLLAEVKQLGKTHSVQIENPSVLPPDRTPQPYYRAVGVLFETKSAWPALIAFLHGLQGPEQCVVVESANIRIDTADASQMRGKFKIAKWYAP